MWTLTYPRNRHVPGTPPCRFCTDCTQAVRDAIKALNGRPFILTYTESI